MLTGWPATAAPDASRARTVTVCLAAQAISACSVAIVSEATVRPGPAEDFHRPAAGQQLVGELNPIDFHVGVGHPPRGVDAQARNTPRQRATASRSMRMVCQAVP